VLTNFWTHQAQEVAELSAQRERFQAQNWANAVQVLDRMINDHQRLADETASALRMRLAAPVPTLDAAAAKPPFVSDQPLEMIDHDLQAHRDMIAMVEGDLPRVTLPLARYLLGAGLQGARTHLELLQGLRSDVAAGRREATLGARSILDQMGQDQKPETNVRQDDVRQVGGDKGKP